MARPDHVNEWALRLNRRDSLTRVSSGSVDRIGSSMLSRALPGPSRRSQRVLSHATGWPTGRGEHQIAKDAISFSYQAIPKCRSAHLALTNSASGNQPEPRWYDQRLDRQSSSPRWKSAGMIKCSSGLVSRDVREPRVYRQSQMEFIQDGVELIAEQNRRTESSKRRLAAGTWSNR